MPDKPPATPPEQPKEPLTPREKLDQMKAKMDRIRQSKNAAEKEALKKEAAELKRQMEQEAKDQEAAEAQGILKEIEKMDAPAPAAADPLVAKVEKLDSFQQNFSKAFSTMSSGTLKGLQFLCAILGFKEAAEFFRAKIDISEVRELMSKKLSKDITPSPEDSVAVKDLRAQYLVKLEKDKKNPTTYPFETFVLQKIEELKAAGIDKPDFTIADLANIPSEEKVEAEKKKEETKKEEEKKKETNDAQKKMKDAIEENPELKQAVYSCVLGKALQTFMQNELVFDKTKIALDNLLSGKEGIQAAKKIATQVKKALETENLGETVLGVELDDGDLEETDGGNLFTDTDIILNFDPEKYPENAVRKLLGLEFKPNENQLSDGTSINKTARRELPRLQEELRKYLAEYGLEPSA